MTKNFTIKTTKAGFSKSALLIGFVHKNVKPEGETGKLFAKTGLNWKKLCDAGNFSGKTGQTLDVLTPPDLAASRLLIVGLGNLQNSEASEKDQKPAKLSDWADLGGKLLALIKNTSTTEIAIIADGIAEESMASMVAGLHLRNYDFDKYKSQIDDDEEEDAKPSNKNITITLHAKNKTALDKQIASRMATVEGTILARDLVNEPPNVLGPVEFASYASDLSSLGIDVEILTPAKMKKLGMGALLAVAQGSVREPRMAIMHWNGGKKNQDPIAFVGKGVIFDSGGISLKPGAGMQEMKGDMGGAAAVIGLMKTIALRKAKVNIVGVIGLVENMPDGNAYRPGDIVTAMSGTTIEIINTDAEGRLVLADALWYTQDRFKPELMINLATLTGAVMVALGQEYAGMFTNDDELATKLHDAGETSGEKLWHLPLAPAYDKLIKSRFADIKNTGGRFGGAITAAQFLQRFVNDVPWAHLDIAGTGFATSANDINTSWASGFGVAVLDEFIKLNYEK